MPSRGVSYSFIWIAIVAVACGGATDTGSNRGVLNADAGTGGSSGGAPSNGGTSSGNGGAKQGTGGASTGGANAGGAPPDGGVCNLCLPIYDLHWGQNGGFVAYVETSRLGPCAAYSHERTPTATDPPSLVCTDHVSACPGSLLDGILAALASPAFKSAMQNHTLYGNDPRPVDGQVFRIGIGNDFIDVGPNCESDPASCPGMPEPVANMVKLLRDLDAAELASDPCKAVFGP